MGSSLNPFGGSGKNGSSSSGTSGLSTEGGLNMNTLNLDNLAGAYENLAGLETGYGTDITGAGAGQYYAGLSGNLTPAQAAMVNYTAGENNLGTNANFAGMSLGGSTMNQQQLNANNLQSLANTSGMMTEDELLGLQAMGSGLAFLNAGGGNLGGAGNIFQNQVTTANAQANANQSQTSNALQQLMSALGQGGTQGTSSTGTSTGGGLGGGLPLGSGGSSIGSIAQLFGGGSGSTASSGAGAVVDSGSFDLPAAASDTGSGITDVGSFLTA